MTESSNRRLDIVILGATGYTGKYAVREVHKLSKDKGGFSWGVAGRNEKKLQDCLKEMSSELGEDLNKIEIIIADISNEDSLLRMAEKAKVVVNCAGPYRKFGEPVVKACIASGTHHVDISGEKIYMEKMQLEYHAAAEQKGVYIVSACGFDSIPADLGTVFLQDKFEGTVNSAETYLEVWTNENVKGSLINIGTWESVVHGVADLSKLKDVRRKLFPTELPEQKPKLKQRSVIHTNDVVQGWCIPFLGADPDVILRSQRHFYENNKQRPVQVHSYVAIKSFFSLIVLALVGIIVGMLSLCACGRTLLMKYPRLFSLNYVSPEGPTEEAADNTFFAMSIYGEGWKEKLSDPNDKFTHPPNKKMTIKVSGHNPAYFSTSVMLAMCAFMCLTETDKMPGRGGVYPPGAAFAKTSVIKLINERGVKFEVLPGP